MGDDDKFKVNVKVGSGNDSRIPDSSPMPNNDQNVIKPSNPVNIQQSESPSNIGDPVIAPSVTPENRYNSSIATADSSFNPAARSAVNPSDSTITSSNGVVQPSNNVSTSSRSLELHTPPGQDMVNTAPSPIPGPPTVNNSPMGSSIGASGSPKPPKGKKKVLLVSVLVALFILGGSASAYFGYIAPNNPANVWSKAMNNTSKGYDKLVEYQESNKDKTASKIEGTYNISSSDFSVDGNYSFEGDQKNTKSRFDVGLMGNRVNIDVLTEISESSTYPDVFFKAEGLKPFGSMFLGSDPEFVSLVDQVENQWFVIDRSFFSQALASGQTSQSENSQVTQEDINALSKAVGDVSKQYIFTTEESKAVFNANEFLGKEDIEGRQQFHYKVGVNKANLKSYVSELVKNLETTEAYKKLTGDSEPINIDDINNSIDEIDDSYKADVWVDAKTKLIRTIRFTDKDNDKNYLDLGLKYDGGDKFPFYIKVVSDDANEKGELNLQITLDTNTDNIDINMTAKVDGDAAADMTLKGSAVFSDQPVNLDNKPNDAKSFMELMGLSSSIDQNFQSQVSPVELYDFDQSNLGPAIVDGQGNIIDSGLLGLNTEMSNQQSNGILNQIYIGLMGLLNQQ